MTHLYRGISGLYFKRSEKNRYNLSRLVKKYNRTESLKQGYIAMGEENLAIARMCFEADEESFRLCEEKLTECE